MKLGFVLTYSLLLLDIVMPTIMDLDLGDIDLHKAIPMARQVAHALCVCQNSAGQ